jgi:hypothetical protein
VKKLVLSSKLTNAARVAAAVAGVAGVALVTPVGASAAAIGINIGGNGTYRIVASCHISGGVATNANQIQWVITAEASAASTNGSVAFATAVNCNVNGVAGVSGALPGPEAVAVGIVALPTGVVPSVTVCGSATYSDGGNYSNC